MTSSAFEGVVGHGRVLDILTRSAANPAHGYLFAGPEGVGKRLVAERFAALLLDHPATAPLEAHPDFVRVVREEEKTELTVKVARELTARMALTSARGGRTVALINDADLLNNEAANALLKGVEEPSPHAVYVFVTSQPEALPSTLRSRLVIVPFDRLTREDMVAFLTARGVAEAQRSTLVVRATGIPARAVRWMEDAANEEARITDAEDTIKKMMRGPLGKVIEKTEYLTKGCDAAEDKDAAWRRALTALMEACAQQFPNDPARAMEAGQGLLYAWRMVGTAVHPRAALEWSAQSPYLVWEDSPHRFFHTPYL